MRRIGITLLMLVLCSALTYTQQGVNPDNVPQINKKYLREFFEEVHRGSPYKYDSEMERIYMEQLKRIEIIKIPYVENKNHKNLSSIERMDKYNPQMSYPELTNFDPERFNFIKYGFNMFKPYSQMIRVDNQDYIIKIKAYKKK